VENVRSWYDPLIKPQEFGSHYFWANFLIVPIRIGSREHDGGIEKLQERKGFDLTKYRLNKVIALRNCVEPEVGKQILDYAINPIEIQQKLI
jgi:DNA (cytosine-5)-methyltransferase 1